MDARLQAASSSAEAISFAHYPIELGKLFVKGTLYYPPKRMSVLDLKQVIDVLGALTDTQMVGYLKITGLKLALLLNFKNARLEWKRIVG